MRLYFSVTEVLNPETQLSWLNENFCGSIKQHLSNLGYFSWTSS